MARAKSKRTFYEKDLTKGELRKLNALRKSLGEEIANEASSKWYEEQTLGSGETDPNVEIIEKALQPHLKNLSSPRGGGYILRRGKGRVIVELME